MGVMHARPKGNKLLSSIKSWARGSQNQVKKKICFAFVHQKNDMSVFHSHCFFLLLVVVI